MSYPTLFAGDKTFDVAVPRLLSRLVVGSIIAVGLIVNTVAQAAVHGFEVGTVALPATTLTPGVMTTVTLDQTYNNPLVFAMTSNQGVDPVAIRVDNVTGNSFDIAQFEPGDPNNNGVGVPGEHGPMNIQYFVIDEGTYNLGGGILIEAGRISTADTVQQSPPFAGTGGFDSVTFSTSFTGTPSVLTQIQTDNSGGLNVDSVTVPWITAHADNLTSSGFDVALERAQVDDGGTVVAEDIGYVAITQGETVIGATDNSNVSLVSLISNNVISGWTNTSGATSGVSVGFGTNLGTDPLAIASLASRDGADGGWLRAGAITGTDILLTVDEDQFTDAERSHNALEAASVVGFSNSSFSFNAAPTPTSLALFSLGSVILVRLRRRNSTTDKNRDAIAA